MENIPFTPVSNLELILGTIAFIAITSLALAVYLKNPKSWTNRLFIILSLVLDAYIISNPISLHPIVHSLKNQIFWVRTDMFLGAFMSPALLFLAHTFPNSKITMPKKYIWIILTSTVICAILSYSPYVFSSLSYPVAGGEVVPQIGYGIPFYFLHFVGLFVLSFVIMFRHYKKTIGIEKVRILYLLIGSIGTFSLLTIFIFFATIFFHNSSLIFLGPIFPVILMASIAYAIVKHKFLDIQPIIARAVSYTFVLGALAIIYAGALFYVVNKFFDIQLNVGVLLINTSLSVLIILTFQPLHTFIGKITDKLFFKGVYDADKILSELTHVITSTINFDDLSSGMLSTIVKEIRVTKAAILLVTDEKITIGKTIGYKDSEILTTDLFIDFLKHTEEMNKRFFVMDDLTQERHKEMFRFHNIEAVFPIRADNKQIAILILGTKLSGIPYSFQDLNLLDVFASEAGIAIQNARLYSDLKIALDAKSRFISVASHQLLTPIAGIKWGLEELKEGENIKKYSDILEKSYQRVIFLGEQLDDILTSLDIYNKKVQIQKEVCDIQKICDEITREYASLIRINNLKIEYKIEEDSKNINADFSKIRKIMHILIKNAILYSEMNQIITVEAKLTVMSGVKQNIISVNDKGIGITNTEKDHIFEEFFRSDRARLKLPDGLGLGMFISKAYIEAQNGNIWIESEGENLGSTIYISLPNKK